MFAILRVCVPIVFAICAGAVAAYANTPRHHQLEERPAYRGRRQAPPEIPRNICSICDVSMDGPARTQRPFQCDHMFHEDCVLSYRAAIRIRGNAQFICPRIGCNSPGLEE